MTPHEDHPGLSREINENIRRSEIEGGVWWKDVENGIRVLARTKNTLYTIEKRDGETFISGHPKYCPDFIKANIHGSTWGGSMIKIGWIGVGMHLEFSTSDYPMAVTTTTIQDVLLEPIL